MVEFFKIKTCHNTILGTDPQNALLAHTLPHELDALLKPVVATRLADVPNHCFVSGLGGRTSRIGCWPDPNHAPILAFRLYELGQSSAALMAPVTRKFLSAHPLGEGNGRAVIVADATNPLGWQALEFQPIPKIFVPAGVEQAFELVAQLLSAESRVGAIEHLLWDADPTVMHPALDSILPVLTNRELQDVAALCLRSYLSVVYPSEKDRRHATNGIQVRVVEYRLEGVADAEPLYRLVTTILDPAQAPAADLAALYHERWEIEGALAELKTQLRGAQVVLRSKTPDLVRQEFWGLLLAHFAVRGLMHEAALRADEDPDRLSFLHAVHVMRRKLPLLAAFPPSGQARPA